MAREKNPTRDGIITTIALVIIGETEMNARKRTRIEFVVCDCSDIWVTETSKDTKRRVIRVI